MSDPKNSHKRSRIFDHDESQANKIMTTMQEILQPLSTQLPIHGSKDTIQSHRALNARFEEPRANTFRGIPASNSKAYSSERETDSFNKETTPSNRKMQLTSDALGNYSTCPTSTFTHATVDPNILKPTNPMKSSGLIFSDDRPRNQLHKSCDFNPNEKETLYTSSIFKPQQDLPIVSNSKTLNTQVSIDFTEQEPFTRPQDPLKYQTNPIKGHPARRKDDAYSSYNPTPSHANERGNRFADQNLNPNLAEPSYQRFHEQGEIISKPIAQDYSAPHRKIDGMTPLNKSFEIDQKIIIDPLSAEKGNSDSLFDNRVSTVSQTLEFIETTSIQPQNMATNRSDYAFSDPSISTNNGQAYSGNNSKGFTSLFDGGDLKQSIYLEESKNTQQNSPPERSRLREKNLGELSKSVIDIKYEMPEWYEKDKDTNLYESMYMIDSIRYANQRTINHNRPNEGEKGNVLKQSMDSIQSARAERRLNPLNFSQKIESPKNEKKWDKHIPRVILFVQKYNAGEMEDDREDEEVKTPKRDIRSQSSDSMRDFLLTDLRHPKARQIYGDMGNGFSHFSVLGAQSRDPRSDRQNLLARNEGPRQPLRIDETRRQQYHH